MRRVPPVADARHDALKVFPPLSGAIEFHLRRTVGAAARDLDVYFLDQCVYLRAGVRTEQRTQKLNPTIR